MRFRFIVILFILFSLSGYSQEKRDSVLLDIDKNAAPSIDFTEAIKYNPSSRSYSNRLSINQMYLGYESLNGNAGLQQIEKKRQHFLVHVDGFQKKSDHTVWGYATYKNGNKDNIQWNETSDFEIVYPYVMADTIGGNNLKFEEYSFAGGYAQRINKLSWGIQLQYRALMEYRKRDPRPDNTVSDLEITSGVHYNLSRRYAVGIGLLYQKYKQQNKLIFYSNLGTPKIYHYTGMGTTSYMFSGKNSETLLDGHSFGINLQLLPITNNGLSATVNYKRFSFEKLMPSFQYLPISELKEDTYQTLLSYQKNTELKSLAIKWSTEYKDRIGTEYKFHSPQSANYEKISEDEMFFNKSFSSKLTFLYEDKSGKSITWNVQPYISIFSLEQKYKSPIRKIKVNSFTPGFDSGVSKIAGSSRFSINTTLAYTIKIDSDFEFNGTPESDYIYNSLQKNYTYLSSDFFHSDLSLQWDYKLPYNLCSFLNLSWQYLKANKTYSSIIGCRLGFIF